jgi:hypothetical protein
MKRNDNDLFYLCSLIEYIGREMKLTRKDVCDQLGESTLRRIYQYAGIFHCVPIEKVANDFIEMCTLQPGDFDNVGLCQYAVPDYWTIGAVYQRLIEDVDGEDIISSAIEVYHSWISDAISKFNTDFYYQSREYISVCYQNNEILP